MTDLGPTRAQRRWRLLRGFAGVAAVVFGLGLVLLVSAVGHCSAFGGRCPAEAPPLFEDDVFGSAAMGGFIAFGIPVWLAQPSLRRLRVAVPVGLAAAVIIGLIARSAALG